VNSVFTDILGAPRAYLMVPTFGAQTFMFQLINLLGGVALKLVQGVTTIMRQH